MITFESAFGCVASCFKTHVCCILGIWSVAHVSLTFLKKKKEKKYRILKQVYSNGKLKVGEWEIYEIKKEVMGIE